MIPFSGRSWGVVGAGKTGVAVARFLRDAGAGVLLVDDNAAQLDVVAAEPSIERRPVSAVLASDAEAWVVSPGVPPTHALVATLLERGLAYGDLDLWQAQRKVCTIAVTGTNGKSTVTRLIGDMLRAAGMRLLLGGNLGTPAVALLNEPGDRAVLEVSSFQLFYARTFRAEIGVLTNLAPDHLDWHRDMAEYVASKRKLFATMDGEAAAVVPRSALEVAALPPAVQRWIVGWDPEADVCLATDVVRVARHNLHFELKVPAALRARHDVENLGCAVAAAAATGCESAAIAKAATDFVKLKYRYAHVATIADVHYINDSKATNLHAMVAAVTSSDRPVHLLLGGKHKGLDWGSVAASIADRVVAAYAFGEAREAVAAAWSGRIAVSTYADLSAALAAAAAAARPGQSVLLAPGTSSFDQYSGYEARGAHFDKLVQDLVEAGR